MKTQMIGSMEYNSELLDLAHKAVEIRSKNALAMDDVLTLMRYVSRDRTVSRLNLWTLHYIRDNFAFADGSQILFDEKIKTLIRE